MSNILRYMIYHMRQVMMIMVFFRW